MALPENEPQTDVGGAHPPTRDRAAEIERRLAEDIAEVSGAPPTPDEVAALRRALESHSTRRQTDK